MSRRRVSEEERALWRTVTRSVSPLRRQRKEAIPAADPTAPAPPPAVRSSSKPPAAAAKPAPKAPLKLAPKPKAPSLEPLDRRAKQRLARGTQAIDARLDLHGRTQSEAHAALERFLHRAQGNGAKTVLVITGKGGRRGTGSDSDYGGGGVLKRQVPLWLALPEFRDLVVGFSAAAIGHGGEGALYVRLRRARA
jgi:DNA-nicking Smr family endonuclease